MQPPPRTPLRTELLWLVGTVVLWCVVTALLASWFLWNFYLASAGC